MAHSIPVIASRIGGLPEVVDDNLTGLLFQPGDINDLVQKLEYLWNNQAICQSMGEAGRVKIAREYSKNRYLENLMKVYKIALQG